MNSIPHLTDNQLILLYYREPLEEPGMDGHLAACVDCLARFESLTRLLAAVSHDDIPEPAGDFESRLTLNVIAVAKNQKERGKILPFRRVTRFLAAGAALAACLILAFSFGRQLGRVEEQALSSEQTQERVLLTALGEHLGRSRVTLVELKNREIKDADLLELQAAAENLVTASRLFRAAAERAGEGQIAGVMEETERLLVRFSAATDGEARSELDGLRKRVDSRDLLFRLQVMEAQVEKRELTLTPGSRTSL